MEKNRLIVTDDKKDLELFPKQRRYRKCKIEQLGNHALDITLKLVKSGKPYREIAKVLSESFEKDVNEDDVRKVLSKNSELMIKYKAYLERNQLERANMVLNEATVLAEDMDKLDTVLMKIEERANNAISSKDLVSLSKAMTDLARTRSDLIKNFKKLTGQFKESGLVTIDQSKKEINIVNNYPSVSSKLQKELSKAVFRQNKVVEADIIEDDFTEEDTKETEAQSTVV